MILLKSHITLKIIIKKVHMLILHDGMKKVIESIKNE